MVFNCSDTRRIKMNMNGIGSRCFDCRMFGGSGGVSRGLQNFMMRSPIHSFLNVQIDTERIAEKVSAKIAAKDTDGDGSLSHGESGMSSYRFNKIDTNKDGLIAAGEYEERIINKLERWEDRFFGFIPRRFDREDAVETVAGNSEVTAGDEATIAAAENPETAAGDETVIAAAEDPEVAAGDETVITAAEDPEVAAGDETVIAAAEDPEVAVEEETVIAAAEDTETAAEEETVIAAAEDTETAAGDETVIAAAEDPEVAAVDETVIAAAEDSETAAEEETVIAAAETAQVVAEEDTAMAAAENPESVVTNNSGASTPNRIDHLFSRLDSNADGVISKEEFKEIVNSRIDQKFDSRSVYSTFAYGTAANQVGNYSLTTMFSQSISLSYGRLSFDMLA